VKASRAALLLLFALVFSCARTGQDEASRHFPSIRDRLRTVGFECEDPLPGSTLSVGIGGDLPQYVSRCFPPGSVTTSLWVLFRPEEEMASRPRCHDGWGNHAGWESYAIGGDEWTLVVAVFEGDGVEWRALLERLAQALDTTWECDEEL